MTKRDKVAFDKAFAEMESEGLFSELRAKIKARSQAKPKAMVSKTAKKTQGRAVADSVSVARSGPKVSVAAHKR